MRNLLLTVLWYTLFLSPAFTQEFSYTRYDTKDGLANSTVYNMCQSRDGFIWFGTETGLNRFDGCRFKTFTTADGLPSNQVLNIWEDSRGRLWLMTFKPAICYYAGGKIHNRDNDSILKKIDIHSGWNSIAESPDGDIIIQEPYITHVIQRTGNVITYPWGALNSQKSVPVLFNIKNFSGQLPLNFVNLPGKIRNAVRPDWILLYQSAPADTPYYAFAGWDSVIFMSASGTQNIHAPYAQQRQVFLNRNQYIIYNRHKGLRIFDRDKNTVSASYLSDYIINAVIKDREQNLWFSTQGSGVFKISPNRFKNLFINRIKGDTYICDIHKVGSSVCIGTKNNEYWKFDPVNDLFFQQEASNTTRPVITNDQFLEQLPGRTLFQLANSDFLNIARMDTIPSFWGKTIQVLRDTLLSANCFGVFEMNARHKKLIRTLYPYRATCAYKQGAIYYIGTLQGLYATTGGNTITDMGRQFPAFKNNISTFAESDDGTLWIGTNGGGVYGYRAGKIIARLDHSSGLNSDMCSSLFASGNKLWVGSEKGLNQVDITPGVYKVVSNITASDGLNSNIVNTIYVDGHFVYIGTPVGITVFDERTVRTHGTCYLNMTGIIVSGQPEDTRQHHLLLKHKDNNISFEYSGISFLSGGDITYKYRVLGLDDTWKYTREAVLTYPALPSGNYTLELIAINKFRDESKPLRYHFEIEQSLWETTWFKIVLALAGVLIITLVVRYIILLSHRKEKKQLLMDHKIKSLEQMALRAQMNPHFIFNCLNSMQRYIIDGDIKRANFYLSRFAELVRETLDNAARIFISVEEEVRYLSRYIELERLQTRDAFDYTIDIDPRINPAQLMIPNMVLQPFVENAIKHGLDHPGIKGKLTVSFKLLDEEEVLQCIVADNGPGIKAGTALKQQHGRQFAAKGISITDKRIRTLNQLAPGAPPIQIQVIDIGQQESSIGTGTRIIINLPIKYYDQERNY
ncbi:sensor histidine kinase [Taibaiella chishuiensis]|uniref:Two component regulator with propeller domain n=1 Tax=Taibaiella chishuiensis TaxID=1434707 RepID=A0A2P8D8I9_9BACT|nr:sensor histidine kinase [Taibaiella chishuiensis]PSK93545.1 two component regulator with propeller domain [Taibaiella chishuiensis]